MPIYTKKDIRQLVVSQTGRSDLVVNEASGDYSDRGADFHIDAGLRYIADSEPSKSMERRFVQSIYEGQREVYFPFARSIEDLTLDDLPARLTRLMPQELRHFSRRDSDGDPESGRPCQFCVDDFNGEMTIGSTENTSGDTQVGENWVLTNDADSDINLSQRQFTLNCEAGETEVLATYQFNYSDPSVEKITPFRNMSLQMKVVMDDGYLEIMFRGPEEEDQSVIFESPKDGYVSLNAVAVGNGFNRFRIRYYREGTGDPIGPCVISDIRLFAHGTERVLLNPYSDGTYALYAHGRFQTILSHDDDHNWWTNEYPDVVVTAAKLSIEGQLNRNGEGENQYTMSLDRRLRKIHYAHTRSKFGNRPLRRRG